MYLIHTQYGLQDIYKHRIIKEVERGQIKLIDIIDNVMTKVTDCHHFIYKICLFINNIYKARHSQLHALKCDI